MRFVIVTGMSGAGKSTAMKMMEDMGFFCIDNLPIPLLDKLVDFATNFDTQMKNVAIGIDARSGENLDKVQDMLEILKSKDHGVAGFCPTGGWGMISIWVTLMWGHQLASTAPSARSSRAK